MGTSLVPVSDLLEFGGMRMLSENEEARARLEADVRRGIAKREELGARQLIIQHPRRFAPTGDHFDRNR